MFFVQGRNDNGNHFEPTNKSASIHYTRRNLGVAAEPGFLIERARFARPMPLAEGFDAIEAYLGGIGRSPTAFCACELLSFLT